MEFTKKCKIHSNNVLIYICLTENCMRCNESKFRLLCLRCLATNHTQNNQHCKLIDDFLKKENKDEYAKLEDKI